MLKFTSVLLVCFMLIGCSTGKNNQVNVEESNISVATVQREIKEGMSSAEVVEALGSPNMVTTDAQRREVWVYDKVSTVSTSSGSQGTMFLLLVGASLSKASHSSNQKTLTIIIKYDENQKVRDYSYRQSSF